MNTIGTNRIGVDIGGSHITAAGVNINEGKILLPSYHRAKIDCHASSEEILTSWASAIKTVIHHSTSPCELLGFAMPGPFDYSNGISLMKNVAKYDSLYGINIRDELSKRLHLEPHKIFFRNDAEAFLEGEMNFGSGKGLPTGMGLTLGTGLGTALFHQKKATDMGLGMSHPLHSGVAEDYISTRWFVARYQQLTGRSIDGVKKIASNYETDPIARQLFQEFRKNIAQFIYEFVRSCEAQNNFIPRTIIIGGNIAEASALFFPEVETMLTPFAKKGTPRIQLSKSILNEDAALMGSVIIQYTNPSLSIE